MSIFGPSVPAPKPVVITVWAEESGFLTKGRFEWSFGNGATDKNSGYTMMKSGNITMMSLTAPQVSSGSAAVNISVNGVDTSYGVSIPKGDQSVFKHFYRPYYVEAGSVINFISAASSKETTASVVALLIELF